MKQEDHYPPDVVMARFHDLMDRMLRSLTPSPRISSWVASADCSGTRTPSHTSEGSSRKRARASRGPRSSGATRSPRPS